MSQTYISTSLRRLVRDRAEGCCEYCLIPESATLAKHQIDHIIAEKHGGATVEENLALSCTLCNKCKGSDLSSIDPETGEIVALYNPRKDRWSQNFQLNDGAIAPLTPAGRATARLLQFDRPQRVRERRLFVAAGILKIPD